MMNYLYKILAITFFASLFMACEDEIFPELESADPILVVDAWVTNKPGVQVIKLTRSQTYFDTTLPSGVSGAQVQITDDLGKVYSFDESTNGNYEWVPVGAEVFGEVGRKYELSIQVGGETFTATSAMNRVPVIDSVSFTFEEANAFQDDAYFADFWATDPMGPDDNYWIKAWKNGVLLNKPGEINVAYDAGFSAGGNFDGVTFITPIRRAINPFEVDDQDLLISPYLPGDSVYVEIHSITLQAFNFMNEVRVQTDRPGGFAELFSTPLSNVSTNVINTSGVSKVVGFFNTAAVSTSGRKLEQ
ncbi:MAG: DUF4249 domain-containing protein [Cyclobacteriaceae bacterium]|nr:DUF4249 domain-containing protein [Cyclobacteriaceae bacterium]